MKKLLLTLLVLFIGTQPFVNCVAADPRGSKVRQDVPPIEDNPPEEPEASSS